MNKLILTATLFSAFSLCACTELDNFLSTNNETKTSSKVGTEIVTKKNHVYYMSDTEMDWSGAQSYCKKHGMQLASWTRTETGFDGRVTRVVSDNPICISSTGGSIWKTMNEYAKKSNSCKEFTNLTTTDTYVWFSPLLDTSSNGLALVINLKMVEHMLVHTMNGQH